MTDKQIKEVFKNGFYCIEPCPEIKELLAELKRKEQECERLKEQLTILDDEDAVVEITVKQFEEYKKLKSKEQECEHWKHQAELGVDTTDRLTKELEEKEQECERLKEEIKKHNDDMFKNAPEKRFYCKGCTLPYISKKLKQTLTEIKEIIKFNKVNRLSGGADISIEQILQKISECEANQ